MCTNSQMIVDLRRIAPVAVANTACRCLSTPTTGFCVRRERLIVGELLRDNTEGGRRSKRGNSGGVMIRSS